MAYLYFHRKPDTIPASDTGSPYPIIHFPKEEFEKVMDMLRNEKPAYVYYIEDSHMGIVRTLFEPAGEAEK